VAVLAMSKQEFRRLDVLLRVQSGGLRINDACVLIGLQRRQVFRLLRARASRRFWFPRNEANSAISNLGFVAAVFDLRVSLIETARRNAGRALLGPYNGSPTDGL
jgi:hypothetical protein